MGIQSIQHPIRQNSQCLASNTRHAKKQENKTHNEEKKATSETDPELIQVLELDIKEIIITVSHKFKKPEKTKCVNYIYGRYKKT